RGRARGGGRAFALTDWPQLPGQCRSFLRCFPLTLALEICPVLDLVEHFLRDAYAAVRKRARGMDGNDRTLLGLFIVKEYRAAALPPFGVDHVFDEVLIDLLDAPGVVPLGAERLVRLHGVAGVVDEKVGELIGRADGEAEPADLAILQQTAIVGNENGP